MRTKGANKDGILGTNLVLSIVGLVLLIGVTWYFQLSLNSKRQQIEYDRELILQLQDQLTVKVTHWDTYIAIYMCSYITKHNMLDTCSCIAI